MWFDPDMITNISKHNTTSHTHACKTIVGDVRKPVCEMDMVDQDFVLDCQHRSHDSVKQLFKVWSDAPLSKDVEEGKLF